MSAKKTLKKCLQKLSSGELKRFVSELLDRGGEPCVYTNQVEGRDVIEVTNVMVSVFSERNVLSVAAEVLREANLGGYADELDAAAPGPASGPPSRPAHVVLGPGPSNSAPSPGGSLSAKEFVNKYKMELIKRLTDTDPLFDELLHDKVLNDSSYCEFKALPTDRGRMSKLLMGPYLKSSAASQIFYNFLKEEQPFLISDLLES